MNEYGRQPSLRRRLSCRLSIFRRPSKRASRDDERPKSRKLVEGPTSSFRPFIDVMEVANEKNYIVEEVGPNTIGDLADDFDSHALRQIMDTAERRRDSERRRSIIQLGFRLAHLTGRQNARQSMAESDTESLLQDSHITHGRTFSRPVSMVLRDPESHPFPIPNSTVFRGSEPQKPSRPSSLIFRNPESRDPSRPNSVMARNMESRASSRPASRILRSPEPQESPRPNSGMARHSPRPNSMMFRSTESQDSSRADSAMARNMSSPRPSSMVLRTPDLASDPPVEVGIRVGELDPKIRKPYVYSPLQSDRVIRLVSVRRPSVDIYRGGYYFQVMIMSLDDPVPYETVSYVWGGFDRNCRLNFMDGSYLPITENLASALLTISSHCKTGYLYIDQVCIDQANLGERNYQAKIAGDITRRASRLLVSLSLPSEDVRTLSPLVDLASEHESNRRSVVDLQWALAPLLQSDETDSLTSVHWRCMVQLLGNQWFTRAWVFQEVVFSQTVAFMFERRLVSFDALVRLALATSRMETDSGINPPDGVTVQPGFHQLYSMVKHRSDWLTSGRPPDFWQLLSETAPCSRTSDDRDSLYSLLGFLQDDSIKIQPNYRIARHDVFIDAARCLIEGKHSLDILSFVPRLRRDGTREEGMPSWVPDWSQTEE